MLSAVLSDGHADSNEQAGLDDLLCGETPQIALGSLFDIAPPFVSSLPLAAGSVRRMRSTQRWMQSQARMQ